MGKKKTQQNQENKQNQQSTIKTPIPFFNFLHYVLLIIHILIVFAYIYETKEFPEFSFLSLPTTYFLTFIFLGVVISIILYIIAKKIVGKEKDLNEKEYLTFGIVYVVILIITVCITSFGHFEWTDDLVELRKQKELEKGGCYYIQTSFSTKPYKLHRVVIYGDCPYVLNETIHIKEESCKTIERTTHCDVVDEELESPFLNGIEFKPGSNKFGYFMLVELVYCICAFNEWRKLKKTKHYRD